jgi:glycosyltransferase involved in cell wall biosynthesis
MHRLRAVVVTPTFDEKDNIADLIEAVLAEQAAVDAFELHLLVADSHSADGTLEIVAALAGQNPRVHLLDVQERGIGIGLFRGFQHAIDALDADVLIEMDADFQHNPQDIPLFLAKIAEGYDVVVGSRFVDGSVNRMPCPPQAAQRGGQPDGAQRAGPARRHRDHHLLPRLHQGNLPQGRSRHRALAGKIVHLRAGLSSASAGDRRARHRDPHDHAPPHAGLLQDGLLALHPRYPALLRPRAAGHGATGHQRARSRPGRSLMLTDS